MLVISDTGCTLPQRRNGHWEKDVSLAKDISPDG